MGVIIGVKVLDTADKIGNSKDNELQSKSSFNKIYSPLEDVSTGVMVLDKQQSGGNVNEIFPMNASIHRYYGNL